jgi:hypothetical protein
MGMDEHQSQNHRDGYRYGHRNADGPRSSHHSLLLSHSITSPVTCQMEYVGQ